jgi:serine/threonine protein kinase
MRCCRPRHCTQDFSRNRMLGGGQEQASIWSRYKPISLIGQGVYGKVSKAVCKETRKVVAVKETVSDVDGILPTTLRELAIMAQMKHRNLVT